MIDAEGASAVFSGTNTQPRPRPGLLGLGLLTPGGFCANYTSTRWPHRVRAPPKRGTVLRLRQRSRTHGTGYVGPLRRSTDYTPRVGARTPHNLAGHDALGDLRHVADPLQPGAGRAPVPSRSGSESCRSQRPQTQAVAPGIAAEPRADPPPVLKTTIRMLASLRNRYARHSRSTQRTPSSRPRSRLREPSPRSSRQPEHGVGATHRGPARQDRPHRCGHTRPWAQPSPTVHRHPRCNRAVHSLRWQPPFGGLAHPGRPNTAPRRLALFCIHEGYRRTGDPSQRRDVCCSAEPGRSTPLARQNSQWPDVGRRYNPMVIRGEAPLQP